MHKVIVHQIVDLFDCS